MGVGEARGKLLLFGEHAAVYGHPALGCSLPWGVRVSHQPGPRWEFPGLGRHVGAVWALLEKLRTLAAEEGLALSPGLLQVVTDLPLGSGFGSSGALCAALVNLFWGGLPLRDRDALAWKAESVFHGTPSGIDTALALRQGWWSLDASTRPVTASHLPDPGLVLVTGAVVRQSDTKTLVGELARRRADGERLVHESLESLGELSRRAIQAVSGAPSELPHLIREARGQLQRLGLETPPLRAVLDAGLKAGALAGKLSGAGGGGAFYLLFEGNEAAEGALSAVTGAVEPSLWTAPPRLVSV